MLHSTGLAGFVLAAAVLTVGVGTDAAKPHDDEGRGQGEAEKKLRERLAVLQEITNLATKAFESSQGTFAEVLDAQKSVIAATLELTKDPAKRLAILSEQVELATKLEDAVRRIVEARGASRIDLLKATAARLKAEADLAAARDPQPK